MITLSEKKSLGVVGRFLSDYYLRSKSDDLGSFLGDINLDVWNGNITGDPAAMGEWIDCIDARLGPASLGEPRKLTEAQAYQAMIDYLQQYWERGKETEQDIKDLINRLSPGPNGQPADPEALANWHKYFEEEDRMARLRARVTAKS